MSVLVIQMAMGAYRQRLLDELAAKVADIEFLVGDRHFVTDLRTDVSSSLITPTGANRFFLGSRIGLQGGVFRRAVRNLDDVVVELNPRNLTSWGILLVRRALGRATVGWGHAHSRSGPDARSNRLRRVMQRQCTSLLAYTHSEGTELQCIFPRKQVVVAANAVYRESEMMPAGPIDRRTDFVLIGRLVEEKRPLLALEAMLLALDVLPTETVLHVVGSGPLERDVRAFISRSPRLQKRVRLHGTVTDRAALEGIFSRCVAMVAAGYVGLNVVQSLGFGVPVIYPEGEPHAPERECLTQSNSRTFPAGDSRALARRLIEFSSFRDEWAPKGELISKRVREKYSVERMAKAFLELKGARPTRPDRAITPSSGEYGEGV